MTDFRKYVEEQEKSGAFDEYKDVNGVQQRLLDLWLGDRRDVCVVGDPAQTIVVSLGKNILIVRTPMKKFGVP